MKERLINFLAYTGISQGKFEQQCGLSNGFVNNVGDSIRKNNLEKISNVYPNLNINWLKTGEGEMLKNNVENAISDTSNNYRLVPLIHIDAVGGLHKGNAIMNEPEYVISMIPFNDALNEDKCIQVTGDSMIPACPPGSIVLIREVEKWEEYFGFGNIFVLLLKDGRRVLKRVTKSDDDPKLFVKCVSINPDYPEEDLPKKMIAGVWKVVKILTNRGW